MTKNKINNLSNMATTIKGTEINAPIWGGHKTALLTSWSEIKKLGFKKRDRAFGQLEDGTPALFFMANGFNLSPEQLAECKYEWYVTTETLDEIAD